MNKIEPEMSKILKFKKRLKERKRDINNLKQCNN